MGVWGTSLYANDSASDIRGDYVDQLKRGKTNEEATQFLIDQNIEILDDLEEAPLFWFALADTQWNYGRLMPKVLDKALYYLKQDDELHRWADSGEKQLNAWKATLKKLEVKLNTPQPPEKKIAKYHFYKCKWDLGDVYAYRFYSEFSKKQGYFGKYVVMRKITEVFCWPGHTIPVVNIYKKIWNELPGMEELNDLSFLEMVHPNIKQKRELRDQDYRIELMSTSQRVIPKNNLFLIGNLQGVDIIPYQGKECYFGYQSVGWEGSAYNTTFESQVIEMLKLWCEM